MRLEMNRRKYLAWSVIGIYLIAIVEMVMMISPFALYFYSLYSPFLSWIHRQPNLVWLGEFFVTHLSEPKYFIWKVIVQFFQCLFVIGFCSFIFHAIYLYWTKFFRHAVATRFLYQSIRHPQYVSLALAGFGLLFLWPRFLNVVLYLSMLFAYYLLAKLEEGRLQQLHPITYEDYQKNTSMFFPRGLGLKFINSIFGWCPISVRLGYFFLSVFIVSLVFSFLLREISIRNLNFNVLDNKNMLVEFNETKKINLELLKQKLLQLSEDAFIRNGGKTVYYLISGRKNAQHLLIDAGIVHSNITDQLRDGELLVIEGEAYYPCLGNLCKLMQNPEEILKATVVRRIDRLFSFSEKLQQFIPLDLSKFILYEHASMPVL